MKRYLLLINKRESHIKCHVIDNFQVLTNRNYEFKKVKSMAELHDNKVILKLVFSIKNLKQHYEDVSDESSDICGSD